MAFDLMEDLRGSISDTLKVLVENATEEQDLQTSTANWLNSKMPAAIAAASDELSKVVSDEAHPWTLRPQYSNLQGTLYNRYINYIGKDLARLDDRSTPVQWENKIIFWLAQNKDVDTVLETYVRLKAYHEVAMERFVDNVALQVVERHLLGPSSPLRIFTPSYIVKVAEEDPELLKSIAGENEDKTERREDITTEIDSLREALESARRFGISST